MSSFQLSVVAPDKTVVDEVTEIVAAPGVEGYFGVMAGHEPFVTQLKAGVLTYKDAAGQDQTVAIAGGFLEAGRDHVIVLADAAERSGDIDEARALAAIERAKARLQKPGADVNVARAQAALEKAANRLRFLGR